MQPEQQQRIMGYFIEEAKDHLNTIEQGLLNLQNTLQDSEMVNEVFRAAHSVKGGAAMLGLTSIQKTAHRLEDSFKILKECPVKIDQKLESLFLKVFDPLQELVEQLQGPFGLTDEAANGIMSGTEPVFEELNNHLQQLVNGTGSEPTQAAPAFSKQTPTRANTSKKDINILSEVFQIDVLAQLREMLQLFKQPDKPEYRQQLQELCRRIGSLGEQFDLLTWSELLETSSKAIANPENSYRTLASVVIKEIKQAQDLVLTNRGNQIFPSTQLKALLPKVSATKTAAAQLDHTEKYIAYSPSGNNFKEKTNAEVYEQTSRAEPASNSRSMQYSSGKSSSIRQGADPNEPEVGLAELNSLADLFEGESSDLDDTWHEEEIINNADSEQVIDSLNSLDLDLESDFSDLLGDTDNPISDSTEVSIENDDFMSLFGEDFQDEVPAEKEENLHTSALTSNTSEDDFSDLFFEIDTPEPPAAVTVPQDDLTSLFGDDFLQSAEEEVEPQLLEDSLEFSFDDVTNLVSEQPDDNLLDFLIETGDINQLETATPEILEVLEELVIDDDIPVGLDEEALDKSVAEFFDQESAVAQSEDIESDLEESVDEADWAFDDILLDTVPNDSDASSNYADVDLESIMPADELDFDLESISTSPFSFDEQSEEGMDDLFGEMLLQEDIDTPNTSINLEFEESLEAEPPESYIDLFEQQPVVEELLADEQVDLIELGQEEKIADLNTLEDFFEVDPEAIATFNDQSWQLHSEETSEAVATENIEALFDIDLPRATDEIELDEDLFTPAETVEDDWDLETATVMPADLEEVVPPEASENLTALFDMETDPVAALDEHDEDLFGTNWELEEALVAPEAAQKLEALFEEERAGATDALELDEDLFAPEAYEDLLELETTDLLKSSTAADSEWGDLDDLLDVEGELPEEDEAISPSITPTADTVDTSEDEFDDLEAMLGESAAPVASNLDEFDDLEAMLGESAAPVASNLDEFDDLEAMLGESAAPVASGLDEFDDLEAMLGESAAPVASGLDEFDDLEAMLGESAAPVASGLDEFDDLEAMLGSDLPVNQAAPPASAKPPAPAPASTFDDEFGDLEKLLQQTDKTMGGPPTATPGAGQARTSARPRARVFEQTMRVPVKHLDNLSNLVGELVVNRNSLEQDQERMRQFLDNLLNQVQQLSDVGSRMQDLYERSLLENSLIASRQNYRNLSKQDGYLPNINSSGVEYDPLEMDRFTPVHLLSQEMIELIVRVRESASDIEFLVDETDQVARMLRQITTQLQEGLTRSRMVPFAQTVDRLQRGVRDNAIKNGKQVELHVDGRDTLLDKVILEHLTDPLTHMLNNAIAHGIEPPDVRQAAGKPPVGTITIQAFHQGNQTVISVSDDGAGIDAERVKAKAIKMGLVTPEEGRNLSKLDVYDLLFHPGFSIKDKADELSGRGVGMDVVRTSLLDIRGAINTDSTIGKGTTFTIRLPLTLSICKSLCCLSDKASIAFAMDGVEDMLDVPKDRIQTNAEGQSCITWRDSLLPFQPLSELLSYNRQISRGTVYGANREDDMISIVVLRTAGNYLAVQVDKVLGEQEIVIKQLQGPVPKPVGIAGATVLGDGRIMPIADVLELIDLSRGIIRKEGGSGVWPGMQSPAEVLPVKVDPMVLIVDDSITVRELLSMTFNKAGYRVEQARDGQEAWDKLRSGLPCDIVFCDIEMPRMDGLELLSRLQKDDNLNHLPVAMLTSRGADRHRQMAADLGASGYFTKPYLEEALLDAAQRMMKGEVLLVSNA